MAEYDLEKQEALERVYWVITLRNIVAGTTVFLGAVGAIAAKLTTPLILGLLLAVMVFIYNFSAWLFLKRKEALLSAGQVIYLCFGQLLADIFIVTLLVHVTGGILSQFAFMYLLFIVIISMIAPEKKLLSKLLALIIILVYEGLLALESFRIIPPVMVTQMGQEVYRDFGFLLYRLIIFPVFPIAAYFLSTNLSLYLMKGKTSLRERIEELNGVRKHLETALGELGAKTSEISILYEFTARSVSPLDRFVSRLAEVMRAAIVEIIFYEEGKEKTAAAYGYPAPEIPPTATLEIPLQHEKEKLGALKLICFTRKEFSDDEKRIVGIVADRLASEFANLKGETQRLELEKQLKEKLKELEEFHDLAVGRELKMIELEKEIKRLKKS